MKNFIKKFIRTFGIDLTRYPPKSSDEAKIQRLLNYHGISLVLDVGANVGQYTRSIRRAGYKGRIISFEPSSKAHSELERASKYDPGWIIAPRIAIGDMDGEITINISGNSVSSSIANMLDTHVEAWPTSKYVGSERVSIAKLDSVCPTYIHDEDSIFLKIDTQGYESQAIDGALNILPRVSGIQLELSLAPLYEGQLLFVEMVQKVFALGFELHYILPGFTNAQSGRLLQADGIFFRK